MDAASGHGNRPAGYVLVGGQSSRMGRHKGLLTVGGAALAGRTAGLLAVVCESVTLVGHPAAYQHLGYPTVADDLPGAGPLGGIVTALNRAPAGWSLVAACDMPALTAGFLAELARHTTISAADCVVPVTKDGRAHPLCAAYRKYCAAAFEAALAGGVRRMRDALAAVNVEWWRVTGSGPLANVNTPSEWEAFLAHIQTTPGRGE